MNVLVIDVVSRWLSKVVIKSKLALIKNYEIENWNVVFNGEISVFSCYLLSCNILFSLAHSLVLVLENDVITPRQLNLVQVLFEGFSRLKETF